MIKTNKLSTDKGFFFSEYEEVNFYQLVELQTDMSNINPVYKYLANFNIYSHYNYDTFYREYIKLPQIVASIGGLIKIATIIITTINILISDINKFQIIANEVFLEQNLEPAKLQAKYHSSDMSQNVLKLNIKSNFQLNNENKIENLQPIDLLTLKVEERIKHKTTPIINLTSKDYLSILCKMKNRSKNVNLWEGGKSRIKNILILLKL